MSVLNKTIFGNGSNQSPFVNLFNIANWDHAS